MHVLSESINSDYILFWTIKVVATGQKNLSVTLITPPESQNFN